MRDYEEIMLNIRGLLAEGVRPAEGINTAENPDTQPGGKLHRETVMKGSTDQAEAELLLDKVMTPDIPEWLQAESGFVFGSRSAGELVGVRDELKDLATLALEHTTQDFMVFDGLRTEAEQRRLVNRGASRTLNSKHLTGNAIDLVPVNQLGQPVWDWDMIYPIAAAVRFAAAQLGILDMIRWGGVWDVQMNRLGESPEALKRNVDGYVNRRRSSGRSAFIDGPHFEWND